MKQIDLYQLHIPDPAVPFEQSMQTLAELRDQGNDSPDRPIECDARAHRARPEVTPIASVQNRYSFADREWDYVVNYCEQNAIAFIPWAPLRAAKDGGDALERIATAHDATARQVAIAWLLQRSPIMLPIPGTSSVRHLEENIAAASLRLTDEEFRELSRVPEKALTARP